HLRRGWTAVAATAFLVLLALAIVSAAAGFRGLVEKMRRADHLKLLGGRITVPFPGIHRELRTFEAWMALVRRLGLALPALVFFGLGQRDLAVVETARARTRASTSTKDS